MEIQKELMMKPSQCKTPPLLPLPQREKKTCQRGRRRGSKGRVEDSSEDGSQIDERKDHPSKRKNSSTSQKDDKLNEKIEAMEKMMEEQKKMYEEQVEKMSKELKMREIEVKNKEEEEGSNKVHQIVPETTPPLIKGVVVVEINENNESKVSTIHNGMIENPDGTLSRTPQSETWVKNRDLQLKKTYETTPRMPEYLYSIPGHPTPTNLDLSWSFVGDWYDVPINPNHSGAEGEKTRVARIEPYIDINGIIKKAHGIT